MKRKLASISIVLFVFSIFTGNGRGRIQTIVVDTIEEVVDSVKEKDEKDTQQDTQNSSPHQTPLF